MVESVVFWGSGQGFSKFFAYIYGNTQPTAAIGALNESYIPPLSGKKKFVEIGIRDRKLEPVG